MQVSAKTLEIFKAVKRKFAWKLTECSVCGDFSIFEWMYFVLAKRSGRIANGTFSRFDTALYCKRCCTSTKQAFEMTVTYEITASQAAVNNQIRYMQRKLDRTKNVQEILDKAEKETREAQEINKNIVKDILSLPDGDVHPSVHSALVKHVTLEN